MTLDFGSIIASWTTVGPFAKDAIRRWEVFFIKVTPNNGGPVERGFF